ncbi:MAG: hypothetical protein CMN76_15775 [Spirochaetaceae bacterium]|nr:hypothetical protein [Spirochaetaceae bacterium]|tara:strand:+ start:38038 stop:41892 length:3855 start_codon:yes stop_codon:yes gene_type:complete
MEVKAPELDPYSTEFLGSGEHRIIEASAGTGKTHFIEEQILYWILLGARFKDRDEPTIPEIHEILVLTFTEKATGELKLRIRQRLARFVEEGIASLSFKVPFQVDEKTMMKRANQALKRFDSACIFTIHGYCNHIIRTSGLTGDADFTIEQSDILRQEAISELVRQYLLGWFGPALPLALSVCGFFDYRSRFGAEDSFSFDNQLLNLLEHIQEKGLPLDYSELPNSDGATESDLDHEQDPRPVPKPDPEAQTRLDSGTESQLSLFQSRSNPEVALETGSRYAAESVAQPDSHSPAEFASGPESQRGEQSRHGGLPEIDPRIEKRIPELLQSLLDLETNVLQACTELKASLQKEEGWRLPEQLEKDSALHKWLFSVRKTYNSRNRSASLAWLQKVWLLWQALEREDRFAAEFLWPPFQEAAQATIKEMGGSQEPGWDNLETDNILRKLVAYYESCQWISQTIYERFMELCSVQTDRVTAYWKRTNRSLEFQDLLRFVDREVERDPELASMLRQKFPFAVIDEFQDTDPVQWSIFKNIYLVETPGASITVVGDPKQSIYGFRGADISAYGLARRAILQNGIEGRLAVSFRSQAPLLQIFDQLFAHGNWFGDAYHSVSAAADHLRKWKWPEGQDTGPPLEVHDLKDATYQRLRMFETARIIAADIQGLVGHTRILEGRGESEKERILEYEDMAILVSRNKDSRLIEKVLRERSIPCSIYKESGLYTSVPAYEFLVLLSSLQDLDRHYRQLRLTAYFPASPVDVARFPEPGSDHRVVQTLDRLRELASSERWPSFFRSLLDHTQVLDKRESDHQYENRIAVTLQLLEEFSEYAIGHGCSLEELTRHAQQVAYHSELQQDLMRQKREKSGVTIMTIHASKGLQFPVVFSALQYTGGSRTPDILRYQSDEGMKLSLSQSRERVERHKEESLGEDRRLAYVAFTRAALKLFVYYVSEAKQAHPFQKQVLAPVMESLANRGDSQKSLVRFRNAPSAGWSPVFESAADYQDSSERFSFRRLDLDLQFPANQVHSFSSLLRKMSQPENRSLDEKLQELLWQSKPRVMETSAGSGREEMASASEVDLPAGIQFGLLIHSILEELDFAVGANDQYSLALVRRQVSHYFPDRDPAIVVPQIQKLIESTLTASLRPLSTSLRDVPEQDRLAEMEFFSQEEPDQLAKLAGVSLDDLQQVYLRGFVDLIFRIDGRYYLLDWKTNALEAYDRTHMDEEMRRHGYDVQAKIYYHALRKWLSSVIQDFDERRHLGGAFYLFVRGMKSNSDQGIYYLRPEDLHV